MQASWAIFKHAVTMVLRTPYLSLRAIWVGVFLGLLGIGWFWSLSSRLFALQDDLPATISMSTFAVVFIPTLLLIAAGMSTIAVGWHRYVLLPRDETTRRIAPLKARYVLRYFAKFMRILLVTALIALPFSFVLMTLFGGLIFQNVAVMLSFQVFTAFGFTYLLYRWCLPLPAAALGEDMSMTDSWTATAGHQTTIFGLIVLNVLFGFAMTFVQNTLAVPVPPALQTGFTVISAIVQLLVILINISIVTTLYGVIVQNRDIPGRLSPQ